MAINPLKMLSDKVSSMEQSATIAMAQKARELKAQGKDVISLSLGEPDFDTPQHIKDAACQALADGYTKYTPVPGHPTFVNAIVEKFKRDNGLNYKPSEIVVSNGAKQSIANVFLALLNPGDEVVVFAPYWVSYWAIIKFAQGTPKAVSAGIEQDFKVTPGQLEQALNEKTKAIIFSSPCNPTGSVYTRDELEALAEVLKKYPDVIVVSDEIYEYINFTGRHASIGSIEGMEDRTVTVNGMSKGFSMTGWRLGYMGAPEWLAKACGKIQSQFTSGAAAFSQIAGAHALLSDLSPTLDMREAFIQRRDLVIEKIKEVPGINTNHPTGAFYVFPDISELVGKSKNGYTINNGDDFAEYVLEHAHVALVGGGSFGAPNCFRLSYAASEKELLEAIRRMKEVLTGFA